MTTSPPLIAPYKIALFLDFDGTLVDFADHPDAILVPASLPRLLEKLHRQTLGALAIITGRDIAVIDRFLAPVSLPVAGVHGFIRRDASGKLHETPFDAAALEAIERELSQFAKHRPGLLVERKPGSLALHFRRAPHLAAQCLEVAEAAVAGVEGFHLQRGKSVIEMRTAGRDKGEAIAAFLNEPPFRGKVPVFAGDDTTDEDGFRVVNAIAHPDRTTIKIGAGQTQARYRLESIAALKQWLEDISRLG